MIWCEDHDGFICRNSQAIESNCKSLNQSQKASRWEPLFGGACVYPYRSCRWCLVSGKQIWENIASWDGDVVKFGFVNHDAAVLRCPLPILHPRVENEIRFDLVNFDNQHFKRYSTCGWINVMNKDSRPKAESRTEVLSGIGYDEIPIAFGSEVTNTRESIQDMVTKYSHQLLRILLLGLLIRLPHLLWQRDHTTTERFGTRGLWMILLANLSRQCFHRAIKIFNLSYEAYEAYLDIDIIKLHRSSVLWGPTVLLVLIVNPVRENEFF